MATKSKPKEEEAVAGLKSLTSSEAADLVTLLEVASATNDEIERMFLHIYPQHAEKIKKLNVPNAWITHVKSTAGVKGVHALPAASIRGAVLTFRAAAAMLTVALTMIAEGHVDNIIDEDE